MSVNSPNLFSRIFLINKITHKLWFGFGVLLLLILLISIITLRSLDKAHDNTSIVVNKSQPMLITYMDMAETLDSTNAALGFYLLSKTELDKSSYKDSIGNLSKMADEMLKRAKKQSNADVVSRVENIKSNIMKYQSYQEKMLELAVNPDLNQPAVGFSAAKMGPIAAEIQQMFSQMILSESEETASVERKQFFNEISELRQLWMNILINNRAYIAFRNPAIIENLKLYKETFIENVRKMSANEDLLSFEQSDAINTINELQEQYFSLQNELIKIHSSDKWRTDSYLIRNEISPLVNTIKGDINWLVEKQKNATENGAQDLLQQLGTTQKVVSTLMVLGLLISITAVFVLNSVITKPLNTTVDALENIAQGEGDLSQRLIIKGKDEISRLSSSFNRFADKIQNTIRRVSDSVVELTNAESKMSVIINKTAEGTQKQRIHTEQVANAIKDMTTTVKNVVDNANAAAETAKNADEQAHAGYLEVQSTIKSIENLASEVETASQVIHRLEDDSMKIGSVLEVINGIAEQTNLLALNAAIEAARAGEQGRGFAVVADEVRNLAHRTQESTVEIQKMIEHLQNSAEQAVQVMNSGREQAGQSVEQGGKAEESLQYITEAINQITEMNTQIAEVAGQQGQLMEEINRNIISITHEADDSSSNTNELSKASEDLITLSHTLQALVAGFRV